MLRASNLLKIIQLVSDRATLNTGWSISKAHTLVYPLPFWVEMGWGWEGQEQWERKGIVS